MSIVTIHSDGSFDKYCSKCDQVHTVAAADVQVGYSVELDDGRSGKRVEKLGADSIICPPCPTPGCGAVCCYAVTRDQCPPKYHGTPFDQQRRAVNRLGKKLREKGRVCPRCKDDIEAAGDPPDLMDEADAKNLTPPKPRRFRVKEDGTVASRPEGRGELVPNKEKPEPKEPVYPDRTPPKRANTG